MIIKKNVVFLQCESLKSDMSEKLNIYEKIGDFILNVIQLVVGGIIFAAVMADESVKGTTLLLQRLVL